MKKLDNKGFTLVELMTTVVLLAIIIGIAGYSITAVIESSKEKDYQLFIKEIKTSVELYYQECRFVNNDCESQITLGYLVNNGFLKGNSTIKTGDDKDKFTLVNPKDNVDISDCEIEYTYSNGEIVVEAVNPTGSCPTSY